MSLHLTGGTSRATENLSQAMLCAGGDSKWRLTSPNDHGLTKFAVLLSAVRYLMTTY
jgi:hypothetical protein